MFFDEILRRLGTRGMHACMHEPTSSLHDENSNLLTNLLSKINRKKKVTIVLTTTDLYEKLPTSRDFLLKNGRLFKKRK